MRAEQARTATWHDEYVARQQKRRRDHEFYRGRRKRHDDAYHPQEVAPGGRAGEVSYHHYPGGWDKPQPTIDDVLVAEAKPWLLILWEPLPTKTPGPHLASPYCCYLRTVIFYHRPYIVWPFPKIYESRGRLTMNSGPTFFEWDQIETRLGWEAQIIYRGDVWEVSGGRVVWARHPTTRQRGWWMRFHARRKQVQP
jgi:hypothetical protein